ncbi:MAG: hypothetical protein JW832_10720 [Deltaproteobacteria bacterium]|nr:hypothetical protein [Deltaproteobacteria bacterium]
MEKEIRDLKTLVGKMNTMIEEQAKSPGAAPCYANDTAPCYDNYHNYRDCRGYHKYRNHH